MHRSYAYEVITDPDDPAWHGHAQLPPAPWWTRRDVRLASASLVIVSLVVAFIVLTSSEPASRPAERAASQPAATQQPVVVPPPIDSTVPGSAGPARVRVPVAAAPVKPKVSRSRSHFAAGTAVSYVFAAGGSGGAAFGQPGAVTGKAVGLGPSLSAGLEGLALQLGRPLTIISGLRTRGEQEVLYRQFQAGTGNLAAVPGTSRHETGEAADVYVDGVALANVPGAASIAASIGLGFPVPGEPWHVERVATPGLR